MVHVPPVGGLVKEHIEQVEVLLVCERICWGDEGDVLTSCLMMGRVGGFVWGLAAGMLSSCGGASSIGSWFAVIDDGSRILSIPGSRFIRSVWEPVAGDSSLFIPLNIPAN